VTRDEWAKRPMAERSAAAHCICNYALDLPDVPAQQEWSARSLLNIALIGGFGNCDWRKAAIEYVRNAPVPAHDMEPWMAMATNSMSVEGYGKFSEFAQDVAEVARALRDAAGKAQ